MDDPFYPLKRKTDNLKNLPIKPAFDQEKLNTCFTFSATDTSYFSYINENGRENPPPPFSAQHLANNIDAIIPPGVKTEEEDEYGYGGKLCDAFHYIMTYGVHDVKAKPYIGKLSRSEPKFDEKRYKKYYIRSYQRISQRHPNLTELLNSSLIATSMPLFGKTLQAYKNGIYEGLSPQEHETVKAMEDSEFHAVVVVDWGTEDGKNVFIAKNSWGTKWGINGYFKLSETALRQCVMYTCSGGYSTEGEPKRKKRKRNAYKEPSSNIGSILSEGRAFSSKVLTAAWDTAIRVGSENALPCHTCNDVMTEFVEGQVELYPGLQYLDDSPDVINVKVVLRADVSGATYDKVAVISGGGSGHEPAHSGFVGEGMLTAAICGDIFASPPVESILAGIRAVTGSLGCLLIVPNYTGDRLNFGLAAEQAKSEGYEVEMVIVGDDCALPHPRGIAGRRGLAGTIFVHKVAGAAAAAGLSLEVVSAEAKRASEIVGTMGVALSVCTVPGQATLDRLGPGEMELGLGIHGEPGAAVADLQPVDIVVSHVLKQILSQETNYVPISRGSRVVLMINGLGGTPLMELMIAAGKTVSRLQLEYGLAVERVYTGSFITSLDMTGFSISVMKADQTILKRLDAPTKAPNWPGGADGNRPPAKIPIHIPPSQSKKNDEPPSRPEQLTPQGHVLELAIEAAATEIINLRDNLNECDSKVGDGDCGSTMFKGASAVLEDLKKCYPLNDPAETVNEIGSSIRKVMGGTSGIIYDIFIKAAYAQLKANSHSGITALQWAGAFEAALAAISNYGGAKEGYHTLLDALIPASFVLKENLAAGVNPVEAFALSAEAAIAGAESTKNMKAQVGRSSYVFADILASVADPGAIAAASWYKAAALAVKNARKAS